MTVQQTAGAFAPFYNSAKLLYPEITRQDFSRIYKSFQRALARNSSDELVHLSGLKRTAFCVPQDKILYISLKKKDIYHINNNSDALIQNREISEALGELAEIGMQIIRGGRKHFRPIVCVDFSSTPQLSFRAKVTREDKNREAIDEEMSRRRDYNPIQGVPTLYHTGYYQGASRGKPLQKHIEISELLHRDLVDLANGNPKRKLTEKDKREIVCKVAKVLKVFHDDLCIHGDVKLDNVFVSFDENGKIRVKLGDFDSFRDRVEMKDKDFWGTVYYWAPEQFEKHMENQHWDGIKDDPSPQDIWSLGWLIHQLCYSSDPAWLREIEKFIPKYNAWWKKDKKLEKRNKELADDPGNPWKTKIRENAKDELDKARKELEKVYTDIRRKLELHINDMEEPKQENILDYLIWRCWKINPNERIKASEIIDLLQRDIE